MRKYKFRGKDLKTGEWVYGDLVQTGGEPAIYYDDSEHVHTPDVSSDTVGQYTGFDDIAGREIYDGDICTTRNGDAGLVCWMCNGWFLDCEPTHPTRDKFCLDELGDLQIIGNIHDDGLTPLQFDEDEE